MVQTGHMAIMVQIGHMAMVQTGHVAKVQTLFGVKQDPDIPMCCHHFNRRQYQCRHIT